MISFYFYFCLFDVVNVSVNVVRKVCRTQCVNWMYDRSSERFVALFSVRGLINADEVDFASVSDSNVGNFY